MRKNKVFAPRSIRLAIGGVSVAAVLGGCLGYYYAREQTFSYSKNKDRFANLIKARGVLKTKADYDILFGDKAHKDRRALVNRAYTAASESNINEKAIETEAQLRKFLRTVETPSKKAPVEDVSVPEFDRRTDVLYKSAMGIFAKCEDLSYSVPAEFELKKQLFAELSQICDSFDAAGSSVADLTRLRLSKEILRRLHYMKSLDWIPADKKSEFIDACLPVLQRHHDLAPMFRFEYMRIQRQIEYVNGTAKYIPGEPLFDKPKSLSLSEKCQLTIPCVDSAWRSRLDLEFNRVIYTVSGPTDSNETALEQLAHNLRDDHASDGYVKFSGVDWIIYQFEYSDNEVYIYKMVHNVPIYVHQ